MRRLSFLGLALGMALMLPACKREQASAPPPQAAPPAVELASELKMSDPQTATQLLSGFYALENGSWRWTDNKFAVALRPPVGAAQNGARLELKISVPESLAKLLPVTLSAKVGSSELDPEKYTKAGAYVFTRDVPAAALSGNRATIEFATDKAIPPGTDRRQLALVVTSVGLVAK